jgi:crotonobetainyl-CoA:carnitine CoA-transferase CaiB-like acyl-CoA transferase
VTLPLAGLRVLDLTTTIFGPLTTQYLGDLGADVVKIEAPDGDPVRGVGPARSPGMGALFLGANRNKRSIVLDLKREAHKRALWALLGRADIFVHNMRARKIAALGFGPDAVLAANPTLVYAGLHGYGEAGPYADRPAYDDVIQGEAGMTDLFRLRDGEPAMVPSIAVDKGAATIAVSGILAAHIQRLKTGRGVYVEIPMFEAMVSFTLVEHQYGAAFRPPETPYGYARALSPFRRPHRTADGHICMLAYTDRQWAAFWQLTTRPELAAEPRFATMTARSAHIGPLYEAAGQELARRTTADWLDLLGRHEIPAGPARTLEEVRTDPHLEAVGFFRPFEHDSEGPMETPDTPYRFDRQPLPLRRGQPRLGADTAEVLREYGLDADLAAEVLGTEDRAAP